MGLSIVQPRTGASVAPLLVQQASVTRELRNVWHEPLDDVAAAVESIRPPGPRTGTLRVLLADAADAAIAEQLHVGDDPLTLTCPSLPTLDGMTYRPTRQLELAEDPSGRVVLLVGFREVAA